MGLDSLEEARQSEYKYPYHLCHVKRKRESKFIEQFKKAYPQPVENKPRWTGD